MVGISIWNCGFDIFRVFKFLFVEDVNLGDEVRYIGWWGNLEIEIKVCGFWLELKGKDRVLRVLTVVEI